MNYITEVNTKSVSVIIAAYNAQATIDKAIISALSDDCVSEVIVVDDASTDNTLEVVRKADDNSGRLKVFSQETNMGPSAARNKAIKESSSTWISILDSDDFFLADRIKKLLSFTDGYDLIADDMYKISQKDVENTSNEYETLLRPPLLTEKSISLTEFVTSNITKENHNRGELGFIKPLIRRSFLLKNDIYYQEHMRLGEDYEIYVRLLGLGAKMILVPAQGYVSVHREDSLSGMHSIEDLFHLRQCNIKLIKELDLSKSEKKALKKHYISIDCRYQWRLLIEAVKQRRILAAIATFIRPYPVPFYVLKKLIGHFL